MDEEMKIDMKYGVLALFIPLFLIWLALVGYLVLYA